MSGFARAIQISAIELQVRPDVLRGQVEHFLAVLRDEVWQRGELTVPEFGRFRVVPVKKRLVLVPDGSKRFRVPDHQVVKFRAFPNWRRK